MKKLFSKKAIIAVIIAVLIAASALAAVLAGGSGFLSTGLETVFSPFKSAAASVAEVCENLYGYMYKYDSVVKENEELRAQAAGAGESEREIALLEAENERLRQLLDFGSRHSDYVFSPSAVISWSSSNWDSYFTINSGSINSDVAVGDCVITSNGAVVGVVTSVEATTSTCRSVIDTGFSASVNLSNSGATASVGGDYALMRSGSLKLEYFTDSNKILTGDAILTSGQGGSYPPGLLVGYVSSINTGSDGLSQYAVITPAADLDSIVDVYIITDYAIGE